MPIARSVSPSPPSAASSSTSRFALASITACIDFRERGVRKGLATLRRSRWKGGSVLITTRIAPMPSSRLNSTSVGSSVIPGSLRKSSGVFEMYLMSSWRVTAQNDSTSSTSQAWMGDSARSRSQIA